MATKFFESTDCVGKTLILKDGSKNEAYKIAGVFQGSSQSIGDAV